MQLTKLFAVTFVLATGTFAAPAADPDANPTVTKPTKPQPPKIPPPIIINQANSQKNACGNGVTSYCCNSENDGTYTSCKTLDGSNTCSTTIVCCNAAQFSVAICVA